MTLTAGWEANAAALLKGVIEHDDEMGHLANAQPDELRDALRLAARRLRGPSRDALVAGVWWLVQEHTIDARSRAGDAALDLRDTNRPALVARVGEGEPEGPGGRETGLMGFTSDEMRRKLAKVHEGMTNFATDMKAKGIHVGMGSPPFCVTCDQPWPCGTERRAGYGQSKGSPE